MERFSLSQEFQCSLGEAVGFAQHLRAGLHEDLLASVFGALRSHVHIGDAALGLAEILFARHELAIGEFNPRLNRAQTGTIQMQLAQCVNNLGERSLCAGNRS